MFNHVENPKEILEWLSQRNHHMPFEDLAYLLDSSATHEETPPFDAFDEESSMLAEFNFD
ncbi:MAG: hypothetical protein Q9M44_06475 [Ghiorsea sp.]|nr:hypothetical protein [Ghiorsea sp.]